MNGIEILKYGVFGYSLLVGLIVFTISDDLRNPKIFRKCLIASIISFIIGILFEFADIFTIEKGMTLLVMSISIIYLGYYHLLRKLFKVWKGTDPYITSVSSTIGGSPIGGLWTKYPRNRKIMWTDFLFSFAQVLIPIFTIVGLMIMIIEMNK
ncbi:MAG: hypothetical protein COW67_14210 [Flavobacteriales bacterium CG18_big_fil_WC_8_21_14_2_50_32_9]|nr:MAG: hypothetical protein COW67_14210 [Flavobacteriales bacterium CG18_big_fil_WC_8_21_14_2_50_32_9]PJC62771.1 MAG: hypothetical protein CO022_02770 [Flavobacteriales bacterium CG_4_9_14_0_2_um_filter_32_27]